MMLTKGDHVWLRSGGPRMTVTEVYTRDRDGEPVARCRWGADEGEFHTACLTKLTDLLTEER